MFEYCPAPAFFEEKTPADKFLDSMLIGLSPNRFINFNLIDEDFDTPVPWLKGKWKYRFKLFEYRNEKEEILVDWMVGYSLYSETQVYLQNMKEPIQV